MNDNPTSQPTGTSSSSLVEENALKGKNVLIVEDDPQVLKTAEKTLKRAGATVYSANDGRSAFQRLMEHDLDVCIIEMGLQETDAFAFLQEALKVWPWLGLVAIGSNIKETFSALAELGVSHCLEKPFTYDALLKEVLSECNDKQQKGRDSETAELERIQYQLRGLRRITEAAMQAETLGDALRGLCLGIGQYLKFAVIAVMAREENGEMAIFNAQKKVSEQYLDRMTSIILDRYEALTGRTVIGETLTVERTGMEQTSDGANEVSSTFSVPIIASGELRGILTIATTENNQYTRTDVAFLYYAANQLATVFSALAHMRELASVDPMTRLNNRLELDRKMMGAWNQTRTEKRELSIIVMDLDHFKTVNDTYGHLVGDQVLREFAGLLKKVVPEGCVLGRYGGEEFVIVLPQTSQPDAIKLCDEILDDVRAHVFCGDPLPIRITVSLGLASVDTRQDTGKTPQDVLAEADQAMYMAKRAGRDCVRIWSDQSSQADSASILEQQRHQTERAKRQEARILVVDDDDSIRTLLTKVLAKDGYTAEGVDTTKEALRLLKEDTEAFDVILADLRMPEINGIELIKSVHGIDETLITIIVTGHATIDSAVECLRYGAYDLVHKPFEFKQLSAVIRRAVEYRWAQLENRQYERHLFDMVRDNSEKLRQSLNMIKQSYNFTLEAMTGLLDAREKDSGMHSKRVRDIAVLLARRLGLAGDQLEAVAHGALLHDIGKIGIPDKVLLKRGALTAGEWEVMKQHPTIGYKVLRSSEYLSEAAEIVYAHQERYDGSGYPRGLKGEEICLGARIFALVDTYDAMRSDRRYRGAVEKNEALAEIQRFSGKQFDPQVVEVFMLYADEIDDLFLCLKEQDQSNEEEQFAEVKKAQHTDETTRLPEP
jgi:diguanylate cyclase (GGDEF)-like protein/putative nucleotidyltransferase with HDIG domain